MGFLAPMMLLGAAAVTVPLGLHFFYKARYRPLPWAAMRFLKQSIEQTSRRLKFQEWLLLLLRCLCLLLLALAIARPSCSSVYTGGRGEAIDAVLVFDTSYSMGARDGEVNRFERAKTAALTVIDNLPANSTVQVITSAERATAVGPHSPSNLDQARQLVQSLELTSESSDVLAGLGEAENALDRGAGSNKEIYLFTDLQKSGWDRQAGAVKAKAAELKQRATVVIVRCGNPDRPVKNVSVADITFPGGIPHSGTRLQVTVLLQNTGKEPVTKLTVTLEVNGVAASAEAASVDEVGPGQAFPVSLTAKLDKPGAVLLTAQVKSDDLPGDNRLDRLISV
ncbi:MAG: BatA domain-containing protein, partial [Fimbriiglobus sp.]